MGSQDTGMTDVLKATDQALAASPRTKLDNDKLQAAIGRELETQDNRQIYNRAQQRLAREEDRHAEIVEEKAASRDQIEATQASISHLQGLLDAEKKNLADLEIEDASVLQSIHEMRTRGVSI